MEFNSLMVSLGVVVLTVVISAAYQRRKVQKFNTVLTTAQQAINTKDWPAAQQAVEECVKAFPSAAQLRRLLGHVLAHQGDTARAEEEMRMAIALEPRVWDHQVYFATYLIQADRRDEALEMLRTVLREDPSVGESLRDDTGFQALLLPAEQRALFGD